QEGFALGPVNFQVNSAETIFIYGGNGSGKSTFIKTLLQLYVQDRGSIEWDGAIVDANNRDQYRNLFAVVFSDFHLFDELYGVDQVSQELVEEYLTLFEVDHKVSINNGQFSTTQLSTGQRKRLAIIAALLENKPLLVLDEWAADQDPEFRRKFYNVILPFIKSKGITTIAITHDDAYYACCDRIYRMDYGKIVEEQPYRPTLSAA
ncbi:MAG: ATP-binding cassette domain-containing protein, partial [Bacteroidota bacterium]